MIKFLRILNCKNIRTSELLDMIEKLKGFSYGAQTDFLVGLPGEKLIKVILIH